jgi:DNA polymerase I-like protein with 3'-5' exonuclease and polymerase domains
MLYNGVGTREEAKKKIFAWLYNPDSESGIADQFYDREYVKMIYWAKDKVYTPFDRVIPCDERHCISYIIQSTCADNTLRQMIKLWKLFEGRKSYVSFTMHDSVVIDFSKTDRDLLYEMLTLFKQTDLGDYVVNVKCGENYGDMRDL